MLPSFLLCSSTPPLHTSPHPHTSFLPPLFPSLIYSLPSLTNSPFLPSFNVCSLSSVILQLYTYSLDSLFLPLSFSTFKIYFPFYTPPLLPSLLSVTHFSPLFYNITLLYTIYIHPFRFSLFSTFTPSSPFFCSSSVLLYFTYFPIVFSLMHPFHTLLSIRPLVSSTLIHPLRTYPSILRHPTHPLSPLHLHTYIHK